ILFLGDALIGYGEFLENNQPLLPSGYVEEWWVQELEAAGGGKKYSRYIDNPFDVGEKDALKISEELNIPLHPTFVYHWEDINLEELKALVQWRGDGVLEKGRLVLKKSAEKDLLERICIPHTVDRDRIIIDSETFRRCTDPTRFDSVYPLVSKEGKEERELVLEIVSKTIGIKIRQKCPYTVGGRMGRPEKAKERIMSPMVHGLFPVGSAGGNTRSIVKAMGNNYIRVEVANRYCESCRSRSYTLRCPKCNEVTKLYAACTNRRCKKNGQKYFGGAAGVCDSCGQNLSLYSYHDIDIKSEMERAMAGLGVELPKEVKGVIGMISSDKFPEPLEKAILRAANGVSVFKDGTMRFDATDVPLTHFIPREINIDVKALLRMGYSKDIYGNRLVDDEQVVELKVQDIVLADTAADYMIRCCNFIDDLLEKFYGMPRFYNVNERADLYGKLVIGLAPHTSAGVLGRIIGYTKAKVGYAHPFFHAAKRRNCDGDE
ncbi:MAG TPA: DNA polymerase II large subunit, partial [Candidatus Methanofastidiosa archaeon]|nr:DNA polymerase II large subunit [Candidatus Methanofastidiosa archaeon]